MVVAQRQRIPVSRGPVASAQAAQSPRRDICVAQRTPPGGWLRLARRAAECYNRGVKEQQPTNPEQSTPAEADVAVYEGLVSAGLNESEAFRTTHAIRDQAGRNTAEKLESHQRDVDTKVDGVEMRLTAKIDAVDTKVERVDTKVDGVETRLTAKIDAVETKVDRVDTKVDGVETRLTAKIDAVETKVDRVDTKVDAGLKAMKRELAIYRWAFLFLIGLLTLLAALGLADLLKRWFD